LVSVGACVQSSQVGHEPAVIPLIQSLHLSC
jgi:hypothetical protein